MKPTNKVPAATLKALGFEITEGSIFGFPGWARGTCRIGRRNPTYEQVASALYGQGKLDGERETQDTLRRALGINR